MKNLSTILSILSFIGVSILGYLHFNSKNKPTVKPKVIVKQDSNGTKQVIETIQTGANIGYVDLDTLEAKYTFFKKKKAEFEARDKAISTELERMSNEIQNEYNSLSQKAQQGQMSEAEGIAAEKRLMAKQQELERKRQTQGTALLEDQEKFNQDLQDNVRGFLNTYAEENGYEYILAYTSASTILYADKSKDITADVVAALNSGKKFNTKKVK